MNTWGYLILIFALALLAVAMLYSKFAYRSREKSLHHSPMDLLFSPASISVAPVEPATSAVTEGPMDDDAGVSLPLSIPTIRLEVIGESGESSRGEKAVEGKESHRESDYFDELQEAAAGLAALMRSSPVGRVDPVIFAPEENEVSAETAISLPETDTETAGDEEVSADAGVAEDTGSPETEVRASEVVIEVPSLRALLGDEVVGKMDQIDLDLDALELLVESIESSLVAMESRHTLSGEVNSTGGEDLISAAA